MKYFEGLTDENAIKSHYKDLAKRYHPDIGGDTETMKIINEQYKKVLEGAYQKAGFSISEIDELMKKDKEAMEALKLIAALPSIDVELCGNWIWVTGQTKDVKDLLKQAHYRWASKKKAWYWRPKDYVKKSRGQLSLDQIRDKYGSDKIITKRKALV